MPASNERHRLRVSYAPGKTIAGKYELESVLGEGGMGAVWRARNIALEVPVALKLIRSSLNRDVLQNRLLQEARAAAKLGHPAIVRVFDVGKTEHGDPFIVMELLQGESLGSVIATSGRIAATRAVQLLLPIADALSMAHAKRIVHRDLKPDNVFICKGDGQIQPKLVDFGIAKLDEGDGTFVTQAGAVLGSPEYMSPEQARGQEDLDLRTDVWSFCVVLYEALTGQLPFKAANYHALLLMIVESAPPTIQSLAAGDAELSAIIERGMSKDREQRWGSMRELGRALADWLLAQGIREDACGVSIESKWGFEAVPSGVRGSEIVPSGASTMPPPSELMAPRWTRSLFGKQRGRSRQVYAAVGALALLVAAKAVLFKASTVSQLGNSAPIASLSGATAAERPSAAPVAGALPAPSSSTEAAIPPAPSVVSSASNASPKRVAAGTTRAPSPAGQHKRKGTKSGSSGDLLAPY